MRVVSNGFIIVTGLTTESNSGIGGSTSAARGNPHVRKRPGPPSALSLLELDRMTAPFAPPPSRAVKIVLALMASVAIVAPFARRDDGLGWIAFLVITTATIILWGMLFWGFGRALITWWRGGPQN